jgi:coenzyme F420-reducing hydrogenase delta subunit
MGSPSTSGNSFQPAIAGFFCQKCGENCLSRMGESNGEYPAGLMSVRLICAEKVGPDLIKQAFKHGADGVLICGCLVGKCETLDNNTEVLAHIHQTKSVLREMGLAQGRLRQEWICEPEMDLIPDIVQQFARQLRELGPLKVSEPEAVEGNA